MALRSALFAAIAVLLTPSGLYGQAATYGSMIGTVSDPAGAVIPAVKVTVTSQDRGTVYSTVTNVSGNYVQTHLESGVYTIAFEAPGFQRFIQRDVAVSVDRSTRIDAKLDVGQVTQEVTVTGAAPALVTDRAEVSTGLARTELTQLPVLNRNLTALQMLMPGAQLALGQHASSENPQGTLQINTNGLRFGAQNFLIDGTDNNDVVLGIIMVNPTIESVSEYKYTTSNYDAEYAQAGGAVIQVETKSGTNQYHGALFEFLQNDVFKARNPFSEPNGPLPLRWNMFGGALGGPAIKNKLFFFGDYQGARRRTGSSVLTTSPTQAVRNGDFSAFTQPIFDPTTGDQNGKGRLPFEGNRIPASRLSTQARNVVSLVPPPNFGPAGAVNNNFIGSGSEKFDTNQFNLRVDHNITDKTRYFGRYSYNGYLKQGPPAFGEKGGGPGLTGLLFGGKSDSRMQNFVAGASRTVNPSLLTDFRFGYNRYRVHVRGLDFGTNAAEEAGIPGINMPGREDTTGLGIFNISGNGGWIQGFGLAANQCNCPLDEREYVMQFVNNWTKISGNHTFKWGADVRRAQNRRIASDTPRNGTWSFSQNTTGSADVPASGLGPASFMLGLASGFSRTSQASATHEDRQWRMFYFAQDTWRVTRKLTLSLGVRWDTWFPNQVVKAGQGSRYDLTLDKYVVAGVAGHSLSADQQTQWFNFSPRLGIAYQLDSKTVIRTGFGNSYWTEIFGVLFNNLAGGRPISGSTVIPETTIWMPYLNMAVGPPAPIYQEVTSDGFVERLPDTSVTHYPINKKFPNTMSWNFALERLIGQDFTATATYVGNVSRHTDAGTLSLNMAMPGPGSKPERRPMYPKFTRGVGDNFNRGRTHYESLQLKGTRRFGGSLSLLATYTWSKSLVTTGSGLPLDWDESLRKGLTDFDRQHMFTLGHVWALPFGKGRKFLPDARGIVRHLVEGWQFSGTTIAQSGPPFTPGLSSQAQFNADFNTPPDVVPGVGWYDVPGGQNRDAWFNVSAFKYPQPYVYGNAGPYILRGPMLFNADMALLKSFPISETKNLQFRWETFNTLNHTNLAKPNGTIDAGPGAQARVTSILAGTSMRQMQLGLRLEF